MWHQQNLHVTVNFRSVRPAEKVSLGPGVLWVMDVHPGELQYNRKVLDDSDNYVFFSQTQRSLYLLCHSTFANLAWPCYVGSGLKISVTEVICGLLCPVLWSMVQINGEIDKGV